MKTLCPLLTLVTALSWQAVQAGENSLLKTFPVKASQGVAVDSNHFYAISNTRIAKHNKGTGVLISTWEADKKEPSQTHFTHMNSASVIDGKLYAAHSRFPIVPNDNTVEIFQIDGDSIKHETTIRMPKDHGSITWIDRKSDGSWWMCYAVYGKPENQNTRLVKYDFQDGKFTEKQNWIFPRETVAMWESMSCSGGSWGADGNLYITGHDRAEVYVLQLKDNTLQHVRTEPVSGIYGQAIAWDRTSEKPVLWGIVKNKQVSLTLIPGKD